VSNVLLEPDGQVRDINDLTLLGNWYEVDGVRYLMLKQNKNYEDII